MRIRSSFSFRYAVGNVSNVIKRLQDIGSPFAPITDTNSTFGFVKVRKAALKVGLKPVFGVEIGVTPDIGAKRPVAANWTFIAKHDLKPLHELFNLATHQFRYVPLLTVRQALEAEGVIRIVSERSLAASLADHGAIHAPDTFAALSPSLPRGQARRFRELGLPFIATSDNLYPNRDDRQLYEIILGRNAAIQTYPQHILNEQEWRESVEHLVSTDEMNHALRTIVHNYSSVNADLSRAKIYEPERETNLYTMCVRGARSLACDLDDPVYHARLHRELNLIKEKGFEDYFYIIADMVSWARTKMIVGPARGSSCGSLVCYLLGITTIDPIPYGLLFERFIDVNRADLPDIDIDFSETKRELVFDYMRKKYGKDHVARLGTVALYKGRSALNEAAAALRIPRWKIEGLAQALYVRAPGDARASQCIEDTLAETEVGKALCAEYPEIQIAAAMEDLPRHGGQHAAGIVLTHDPILNYVATDHRTQAVQTDKKDAEEIGLLKIDALGLTQLAIFEYACDLAMLDYARIERITASRDDPNCFQVLNDRKYVGVFQFTGQTVKGLASLVKVSSFDDLIVLPAIARPGTLHGGGAHRWAARKRGDESVTYPHPLFEPYLNETLGIIVYQEQIMMLARDIGKMSWEDVSALRKVIQYKLGREAFESYREQWLKGGLSHGIPEKVLDDVWDSILGAGAYSFNKSHSVAYADISYKCCWFKAYHPFEFAAATLTYESDPAKQLPILREMANEGIDYVPIDPERSIDKWTVRREGHEKTLIGPLSLIRGIGPKMMTQIVNRHKNGGLLSDQAKKLLYRPQTPIDSLYPIRDRFEFLLALREKQDIISKSVPLADLTPARDGETVHVQVVISTIKRKDENDPDRLDKRGGIIWDSPTVYLNLFIEDDTDQIFAKVGRFDFERIGKQILERGKAKKALYAMRGFVRASPDFRMIFVKNIKYVGDLHDYQKPDRNSISTAIPEQDWSYSTES